MPKSITIAAVLEAMKKNGYRWTKGDMADDYGSCAFGQTALNLLPKEARYDRNAIHLLGWELHDKLNDWTVPDTIYGIGGSIMGFNDGGNSSSYQEVAEYAEELLTPHLNEEIELRHLEYDTSS